MGIWNNYSELVRVSNMKVLNIPKEIKFDKYEILLITNEIIRSNLDEILFLNRNHCIIPITKSGIIETVKLILYKSDNLNSSLEKSFKDEIDRLQSELKRKYPYDVYPKDYIAIDSYMPTLLYKSIISIIKETAKYIAYRDNIYIDDSIDNNDYDLKEVSKFEYQILTSKNRIKLIDYIPKNINYDKHIQSEDLEKMLKTTGFYYKGNYWMAPRLYSELNIQDIIVSILFNNSNIETEQFIKYTSEKIKKIYCNDIYLDIKQLDRFSIMISKYIYANLK